MKKRVLLFAVLLLLLIPIVKFAVSAGFQERTDVGVRDFELSEDGSTLTIKIALMGSMGYVRAMETEQKGDAIYCTFYRTFGGLNFGFGSRDEFEIPLDGSAAKIYFYRDAGETVLVLEKDAAAKEWVRSWPPRTQ